MLSTLTNTVEYVGNGVTTSFAYGFRIDNASEVVVSLMDLSTYVISVLSASEYTVSGIGEDDGGDVVYPVSGSPLASTQKIIIDRIVPLSQTLDIENQGAFLPEVIEEQFDRVAMALQQLQTNVDRNIYGPDSAAIAAAAAAAAALFVAKTGSTMTGRLITKASSTLSAPVKMPPGVAPTSPEDGDIWTVTAAIKARLNALTMTLAVLDLAQAFTDGAKQTFGHSATTAGLNIKPVAGDPSALANGDVWYNSTVHRGKIRLNGVTQEFAIAGISAEMLGITAGDNEQTGASYTFALSDIGKMVRGNRGTAQTFTIPLNATVAFALNSYIVIGQYGAGQITVSPTGGVTMRSSSAKTKTTGQYSVAILKKIATDEWWLWGDITT